MIKIIIEITSRKMFISIQIVKQISNLGKFYLFIYINYNMVHIIKDVIMNP